MSKTKTVKYSLTFLGEIEIPADIEWDDEAILNKIEENYYNKGLNFNYVNDIEYEVNNHGYRN